MTRKFIKSKIKAYMPGLFEKLRAKRHIPRHLRELGEGYLRSVGWHRSILDWAPVDDNGPVPWITFPARSMLERVVLPSHKVFEFGAGNSSLWWAKRVAEVVSVEHNLKWVEELRKRAPQNLKLVARPINADYDPRHRHLLDDFLSGNPVLPSLGNRVRDIEHGMLIEEFSAYALEIANHPREYFDVIVVDGMARSFTAWLAARWIKQGGFIVFDNSGRSQYNAGYIALHDAGLRRIDFYGPAPLVSFGSCTSIFSRSLDWAASNITVPEKQQSDAGW